MEVFWNVRYEISNVQAVLSNSCAITQTAHFTMQFQYIMMSNLDIWKVGEEHPQQQWYWMFIQGNTYFIQQQVIILTRCEV